MTFNHHHTSRRTIIGAAGTLGVAAGFDALLPGWARGAALRLDPESSVGDVLSGPLIELEIARTPFFVDGRRGRAITINGTVPGPLLRLREGEDVEIAVTNRLDEDTSIHWHGLILPPEMDGVPGISFPGIRPGETFRYRFPLVQSGTYWYHSHSGLQEPMGHYGPLVIEPKEADPVQFDRDIVVVLSDWSFESAQRVFAKLKKHSDVYNINQRTVGDFFRRGRRQGFGDAVRDRSMWGRMRMMPTDISDVTGATYKYLINGHGPQDNWSFLYEEGERVRLRFINAAAMTLFNVRIPGLPMTVVQADGLNVKPVEVDEFQIGNAETFDVIVEPSGEQAYSLVAEAIDRTGMARATLLPKPGMTAAVPELRQPPLLTMKDMGMDHGSMGHESMDHAEMDHAEMDHAEMDLAAMDHAEMNHAEHDDQQDTESHDHSAMDHAAMGHTNTQDTSEGHAEHHDHGAGIVHQPANMTDERGAHAAHADAANAASSHPRGGAVDHPHATGPGVANTADVANSRLHERGVGLENEPHRVLVYTDLVSLERNPDTRAPERTIELHLTGNMERYMWSFDGKKFSEVTDSIVFNEGERLRMVLVNDTMMPHPIHLHGMFFDVVNGAGDHKPRKHTIVVKPAERLAVDITADAVGDWAFHCHLVYHMHAGMFRVVSVRPRAAEPEPASAHEHHHGAAQ